jgi:hypothetical protein
MSSESPFGSERRRLRRRDSNDGPVGRWIDDFAYYGAWQLLAFTLPTLWLAFQTVGVRVSVLTGASLSLVALPLCLALARNGHLGVSWPPIEAVPLGTNPGFRQYLTRGTYFNALVALSSFGGSLATQVTGTALTLYTVVVATAVLGVAAFPRIAGTDRRVRLARALVYLPAFGSIWLPAMPFDPTKGFGMVVLTFLVVAVAAIVDVTVG